MDKIIYYKFLLQLFVYGDVSRLTNVIPIIVEKSIKNYATEMANGNNKFHSSSLLLIELKKEQNKLTSNNNNSSSTTNGKNNLNNSSNRKNNDLHFCNSVLQLVEQKLAAIEMLQMSDLNVSLSHLSDAKHALDMNNISRFKYFIEQSFLKAREAQYKIPNLLYKMYIYSIIIFDGFLIFSDFGKNYVSGLYFIRKTLYEIQNDHNLNNTLNTALNSYFYWNKQQKLLIAHCILFSTKICSLIRAIKSKINSMPKTMITNNNNNNDDDEKDIKFMFYKTQKNCMVLKENDDYDYNDHSEILNINTWIPNIWGGQYFGSKKGDKTGKINYNPSISSKYYLDLFQIIIKSSISDLWYCEETNEIYEYFNKNKLWFKVQDSLLYDYYYHHIIDNKNIITKINSNFNLKAFKDHFSKYLMQNTTLVLRKNWNSLHPKLKLLLKDCLINNYIHIECIDLSYNDNLFGLNGTKYLCDIISSSSSTTSSLKILRCSKNDINFRCIQLFVISLLSIKPKSFCGLTEINFYGNKDIGDDSLYLLLNEGISKKCPNLKKLYLQWTNISNLSCKYIVSFYESCLYHPLFLLYLSGNKKITSIGCCILNAMLQGICINRKDIIINISDCEVNVSQLIKFDSRLIVND